MDNLQIISIIVGIFIGIGALAAGLGFSYSQFKQGGGKAKDDLIDTLKESLGVEQEKNKTLTAARTELINSHQVQLTELNKQLAELKGRFDEQSKKAEEYKALAQGRDPELQKILFEIRAYLKTLTEQSNTNQIRNENIDENTKEETGKVLRKK